ncbi:YdbH domain-containing protein [Sphingomonas montanisoli]|nr:YdbH domain-containing protein [Sphingomonas montanisoli]
MARPSKFVIAGGASGAVIAAALGWLWIERMPIAQSYIDDALTAAHVPASYKLTQIGFRTQRIENIRIGDPKNPDLVADWAEIAIGMGLTGPYVRAIDAAGVRLKGRIVDGKLSLGAIDRLLPKTASDEPFALPDIALAARDLRFDLDTPAGAFGLRLTGGGGLKDGFKGVAQLASAKLAAGGCAVAGTNAKLTVAIANGKPRIDGPLSAAAIDCGASGRLTAPLIDLDITGDADLARWRGAAVVQRGAVSARGARVDRIGGRITIDATMKEVRGGGTLFADGVAAAGFGAARAGFEGDYRYGIASGRAALAGEVALTKASVDAHRIDQVRAMLASTEATPIGPVAMAWGKAVAAATRSVDARASLSVNSDSRGIEARIDRLDADAASGARMLVRAERAEGLGWRSSGSVASINASIELGGGGLPDMRASLRQAVPGGPVGGSATIAPYRVGTARAAFDPVSFGPARGGGTAISTRAHLDGPLADGRIEGLDIPISVAIDRRGGFTVNRECATLAFTSLEAAGTRIGRSRLPVCPVGGAMVGQTAGGQLYGGAAIAAPRLRGAIGDQPLVMEARRLSVSVDTPGFALDALRVRLGTGESPTRLDAETIAGRLDSRGVGGTFAGTSGQIGVVPLLLSDAAGDWTLRGGILDIKGGLAIDDAQTASPRFHRLRMPDATLTLNGGYITANGTLTELATRKSVARVQIRHSLQSGRGDANLDVDGLRFGKGFQPERITPLTVGIIANVEGEIAGQGRIVWAGGNVTSSGVFRTESTNFAAAFGPVTGLRGTINFTDLLAMVTAPGQEVRIAEINPGIAVNDGVIHYHLEAGQVLAVESGKWPFAGGTLTLEPTVMDFGRPVERRMLFRIDGLDAGVFLQQLEFKNLDLTGKFDGVLPIIFSNEGGRIEGGELRVRPEGGTLSYVGDVTNAALGPMARIAFDALKSMRYNRLVIDLNGSLDGEVVSKVRFDGTQNLDRKAEKPKGLIGRFIAPITRLPFRFNITITAPFRGLVNSAQTFVDPASALRNVDIRPNAPPPPNPLPDPPAGSAPVPIQPQ